MRSVAKNGIVPYDDAQEFVRILDATSESGRNMLSGAADWEVNHRHRSHVLLNRVCCLCLDAILNIRLIHVEPVLLLNRSGSSKEGRNLLEEKVIIGIRHTFGSLGMKEADIIVGQFGFESLFDFKWVGAVDVGIVSLPESLEGFPKEFYKMYCPNSAIASVGAFVVIEQTPKIFIFELFGSSDHHRRLFLE
jgi:hypothetical protein